MTLAMTLLFLTTGLISIGLTANQVQILNRKIG